jgi:hypothetical protein
VGTLDGHLATYRHRQLPAGARTAHQAADQLVGASILAPPARLPAPSRPASKSWWHHDGALAVVFSGLPAGDLVLPVRLPLGAGQWAQRAHFLADPGIWHKIDLVRVRDRKAPGGWRYYAHLLIHQAGYQSPSTRTRRAGVPADRRGGVDANVSNLSVASFPADTPEQLVTDQLICTPAQQETAARAAAKTRARQRALDRSRRNTNASQYGPSPRQAAPMGCRCAPTATTSSQVAINTPVPITPPNHAAPARLNSPGLAISPRGSWPPTATPSP